MLKDKVFIKSATHRFPKISQFRQTNAVACRFCKKIFCCAKCRDCHVDKVHPNVNADCSLCASEILPMRQYEFSKLNLEDEKLLCHIVDKHLPLYCRLCGDLFKSKEDFKSIGTCKWFERWHCLTSPSGHEYLEKKSKCSISESNSSKFCTPPEIYRKTSTPMFLGQKVGFETPSVPEFSFKTPTDLSSIAQIASISKTQTSDTPFLSSNEETTPFRTCKDEQFSKSNSGRKLSIMEKKQEKIANNEAEMITANVIEVSSPVDMDLTRSVSSILQDSSKSNDVCEDVVKKVRFSDKYETATEFGNLMESCVRTILDMSMEEDESRDMQKAKTVAEDIKDANNTMDTNSMKDTNTMKYAKNTDNQAENIRRSLTQPSENFLNNSQIRIIEDNMNNIKNITKENQNSEVRVNEDNDGWSIINQQDSNRVLMMVLMSNSGGLTTDLMPLISSGLKKLQEQFISNRQPSSNTAESAKICRRSITTMKMSVKSVENYSADSPARMTNEQFASSSSVQNGENNNNGGFLSSIAQAMKFAFRSLSVSNFRVPKSIEATEVVRRREIVKKLSSPGSSSSTQVRLGKRSRSSFETEMSSKEDSTAFVLNARSPLAKRPRGWYGMIRGRLPINRMRNSRVISPRGVSKETQIFSQGSLTVGDTVLPLPARAHPSTE